MAAPQIQALSNGHKTSISSLKLEESYQSSLFNGESGEYSNKEPWPRPAQRSSGGYSRPRSQSYRQIRLPISIPIAPRNGSIDSVVISPAQKFSPLTSLPQIQPSPSDSNAFLVALAGQERYVFELREELIKAEKELKRLKRYWACHEKSKKNGEIRNMEPLRPLSSSVSDEGDNNNQGVIASQKSEADKRKEMLENSKNSKEMRRTFSGSHARTLSLLSPEKSIFHQSREPKNAQDQKAIEINTIRKSIISGTNRILTEPSCRVKNLYSPKNMTIGGKQLVDIAEDVKEGLKAGVLNFFEDLRQVTVGDESIIKNAASKNTIFDSLIDDQRPIANANQDRMNIKGNLIEISTSPEIHENLIDTSPQIHTCLNIKSEANSLQNKPLKKTNKPKTLSLAIPVVDELDDPWSIWDSPITKSPRWSESTTTSSLTTPPDSGYFDQDLEL